MTSGLLLMALFTAAFPEVQLEPLGRIKHPAIREVSGIVKSRTYPGIFWVHNDSANPPFLFAIRRDGSLVREYTVSVPNIDWEDIATDDQGHLYVGDIGNNFGLLPVRAIYQLDEPNPFQEGTRSISVKTACYYRFPPKGQFDAEGLVIDGERALVVAKSRERVGATVYSLPLRPPAPLLRPAIPQRVATLKGFREPVTGASLSSNGQRLVVCSLHSIGIFERDPSEGWRALSRKSFRPVDQFEAVTWDGDDLILAGENRGLFRIAKSAWSGQRGTPTLSPRR
ncbi:MAG: hypothetical protein NVSMB9_03220 [Isosphaeraceae bacterium]